MKTFQLLVCLLFTFSFNIFSVQRRHQTTSKINAVLKSRVSVNDDAKYSLPPQRPTEKKEIIYRILRREIIFPPDEYKDPAKKIKILVLIIASDHLPVYTKSAELWQSYMNSDPEHIEAYFIKADPDLPTRYKIDGNVIWSKTDENWSPWSAGILNKTILSIEAMMPRLNEFDYVLRTNLSSFFIFSRLIEFVSSLPRNNLYCGSNVGVENEIPIALGCGFLLSRDIAKLLVYNEDKLLGHAELPDDMIIGYFLHCAGISLTPYKRFDVTNINVLEELKDTIPDNIFHFRVKQDSHLRSTDEVTIHETLIKRFYHAEESFIRL